MAFLTARLTALGRFIKTYWTTVQFMLHLILEYLIRQVDLKCFILFSLLQTQHYCTINVFATLNANLMLH